MFDFNFEFALCIFIFLSESLPSAPWIFPARLKSVSPCRTKTTRRRPSAARYNLERGPVKTCFKNDRKEKISNASLLMKPLFRSKTRPSELINGTM